jgi:hypothetical protein
MRASRGELLGALKMMVHVFNAKQIDPLIAFATIEKARAVIERSTHGKASSD